MQPAPDPKLLNLREWIGLYARDSPTHLTTWTEVFAHMHKQQAEGKVWSPPTLPTDYRSAQQYIVKFRKSDQTRGSNLLSATGTRAVILDKATRLHDQLQADSKAHFEYAKSRVNMALYRKTIALVSNGSPHDVYLLLRENGRYVITPKTAYTILHLCARRNRVDILRHIWDKLPLSDSAEHVEPNSTPCKNDAKQERLLDLLVNSVDGDGDGTTPLHLACDRSHMEMISFLIDKGANPFFEPHDEGTGTIVPSPIMLSIRKDAAHLAPLPSVDTRPPGPFLAPFILEYALLAWTFREERWTELRTHILAVVLNYMRVARTGFDITPPFAKVLNLMHAYPPCCPDWTLVITSALRECGEWAWNGYSIPINTLIAAAPPESYRPEHLWLLSGLGIHQSVVTVYLQIQEYLDDEWKMANIWQAFAVLGDRSIGQFQAALYGPFFRNLCSGESIAPVVRDALSILVPAGQVRMVDNLLVRALQFHFSSDIVKCIRECLREQLSQTDHTATPSCHLLATILFYATQGDDRLHHEVCENASDIYFTICNRFQECRRTLISFLSGFLSEIHLCSVVHSYWFSGIGDMYSSSISAETVP